MDNGKQSVRVTQLREQRASRVEPELDLGDARIEILERVGVAVQELVGAGVACGALAAAPCM